jgi:hypothetical protein
LDRRPDKLPNTCSRLIAMAVSLVGAVAPVMAHMRSSPADFEDYRAGRKEPPWSEFDRLVSLIVREQQVVIARNRAFLNGAGRKPDKP